MEGMFNPLSILLHVINAVILLVALYFLLLKPVRKFMDARTAGIAAQLQSVEDAKDELQKQRSELTDEVAAAKKVAADTVARSVAQAHEKAEKVLQEAHGDADHLRKMAKADADAMRDHAREEMRGEVAGLSIQLASKLLKREVTEKDHEKLIADFLKKVV